MRRQRIVGWRTLFVLGEAACPLLGASGQVDSTGPRAATVRLDVRRFSSPLACGSGFFAEADNLVLTTYHNIRGADDVSAVMSDGRPTGNVDVASYGLADNVAVLRLATIRARPLSLAGDRFPGAGRAWGYEGNALASRDVTVAADTSAPLGLLRLRGASISCGEGGPIVDGAGVVFAVLGPDSTALPIQSTRAYLTEARDNIRLGRTLTVRQVAERERHAYGSVVILADNPTALARVRPLEDWHWPGLVTERTPPFEFAGPMGRYSVELVVENIVQGTSTLEVVPGVALRITVSTAAVAGGSSLPLVLGVVGAAAAGGGVFLFQGGGGEASGCPGGQTGTPPNCTPISTTGTIVFTFPNPSIAGTGR